jgi:uncharacterized protein
MSNTLLDDESVAAYLRDHPQFLVQRPDLLTSLTLAHPTGGKTVSLIERQIDLMREKNRALEYKLTTVVRNAQENEAISGKLYSFTRSLLLAQGEQQNLASNLPDALQQNLRSLFSVPQTALRLWEVAEQHQNLECAQPVEVEVITLANSMKSPYCGPNSDFLAASWLVDGGASARSVAMIPLRAGLSPNAFGMLVLGSSDSERFTSDMGTAFLERIGELASAALAGLNAR